MTVKTRFENWKLWRKRKRVEEESKRFLAEAKPEEVNKISKVWKEEIDAVDEEIRYNVSLDLIRQAEKLNLPTPSTGDRDWIDTNKLSYWSQMWNFKILTPEAFSELRTAIRKEKRDRLEDFGVWIRIVGGGVGILTGLVGALIGLVAIWKK